MAEDGPLRLHRRDVGPAARMCARAFGDAPHVVHFFPDASRRGRDSAAMFEMRLRYGLLYGEVHVSSEALEGFAVWLPSERATMLLWGQIRSGGTRLYRAVGSDAVARMTHVAEHNDRLRLGQVSGPHWFLSIVAVDPEHQRCGHATSLLEPMLERLDRERLACYVETTDPDLLRFYERLGFETGAESTVPGTDLTVWPLVRSPKALG